MEGIWKVSICAFLRTFVGNIGNERKLLYKFLMLLVWNSASAGSKRDADERMPVKNIDADDSDAEAKSDSDER
jgi:hypothetical protein